MSALLKPLATQYFSPCVLNPREGLIGKTLSHHGLKLRDDSPVMNLNGSSHVKKESQQICPHRL